MSNIIPRAEAVTIEQIVGCQRQNSKIPANQKYHKMKEMQDQKIKLFEMKPFWFRQDRISMYEENIFFQYFSEENSRENISITSSETVPEGTESGKNTQPISNGTENRKISRNDYLAIRNRIICVYYQKQNRITVRYLRKKIPDINMKYLLEIFNFLEDAKIINYRTKQKELIDELRNSSQFNPEKPLVKKPVARYIPREFLSKAMCVCGEKAVWFTTDLFMCCEKCFQNEEYPRKYVFSNFHMVTDTLLNKLWTKEEEYILLSNILKYGDEWEKVTMGLKKTVGESIFHFVTMPLIERLDSFPSPPFGTFPNPITTLISYLSKELDPSISAEIAKTCIKYIEHPNIVENLLSVAVEKSKFVLEIEIKKKKRLEEVKYEALIKRMSLKIDAIKNTYLEISQIKSELNDARERLKEDFIVNSSRNK